MGNKIILITGGVKSGKSAMALKRGEEKGPRRAFIATALSLDDEMEQKILAHRSERGDRWTTFEESRDIAGLINKIHGNFDIVLIDCLTMWVSNLLTVFNMTKEKILKESARLISGLEKTPLEIILVTNEVNMGIMPGDHVSRIYQALLGSLNRDAANIANSVYFLISGIPLKIK